MLDALTDALQYWNRCKWNEISECSLGRDDVTLRWNGNHVPERNSEHGTVADFYDIHHSLTHRDIFFGKVPGAMKHMKGQWMRLELFIDVEAFEQRTGVSAPDEAKSANARKRAAPSQISNNAETGEITISWDENAGAVVTPARIADTVDSMGKTKKVFLAELDSGKPFVAKRFFEIGHGSERVSCKENTDLLQLEAQRLVLGKYFFDLFYERARGLDAEVCDDFAFTSCYLAREIVGPNGPSKASGISQESWASLTEKDPDSTIIWLLEPRRSKSVTRWSGTLAHSKRADKRHSTMGAFVHFAYDWSQQTVVFADLQSSAGKLPGPHMQYGNILFDVMTHTPEGESGVGDHSIDGILSFLKGHSCHKACEDLQLAEIDVAAFRRRHCGDRHLRAVNSVGHDDDVEYEDADKDDDNENENENENNVTDNE
ncbi:kinase-like domain-containing protein [Ganoderma leucocontextum]|nr:kinase-like domain-containing protein [Ganoderma leucocontextum]